MRTSPAEAVCLLLAGCGLCSGGHGVKLWGECWKGLGLLSLWAALTAVPKVVTLGRDMAVALGLKALTLWTQRKAGAKPHTCPVSNEPRFTRH